MNARTPTRTRTRAIGLVALAAAGLAGAVAATGLANVTVYKNNFSKQGEVRQLTKTDGGQRCRRNFARGASKLRVILASGPGRCAFRPPVEGDSPLPNHIFRADARIARQGPQAARQSAFLLLRIRAGEGSNYELRVLPRGGRFELRRRPDSGQFPITGTSDAISGIGRLNQIRLVTSGAEVRATVNGSLIAAVTDSNPGAVSGTRLHFGVGHELDTNRDFFAIFDRITVSVPSP